MENYITVSDLNKLIKSCIDQTPILKNIVVRGELQGFKKHSSGHYFFKLIDESAQISSTIFSFSDYSNYSKSFKDGDLVEVTGTITFYNKRGDINFTISRMKLCGDGDKLLKKKELIQKLYNLGYLDESKKKPIPKFPKNVGIITSKTGAAIVDITKNIDDRTKRVQMYLFPCIVQGDLAKNSILEAIEKTKEYDLDVIIIGRGGGSKEDLSAFDEESVALAIYDLDVPVIAAVGHEIDKSVVDLVADLSVSTPTAAAVAAVPNDKDILDYVETQETTLQVFMKQKLGNLALKISNYENYSFFKDYGNYFKNLKLKIENSSLSLENYYKTTIKLLNEKLQRKTDYLESINPLNILEKGYSVIYDSENHIIDSVEVLKDTEEFVVQTKDGKIVVKGGTKHEI